MKFVKLRKIIIFHYNRMVNQTWYTFRYDYTDKTFLDILLPYIKRECSKYVIFDEIATETGKSHIQGKVMPVKSCVRFREDMRKQYKGFFERSNYSIAPIQKPDEYDLYICKDKRPVINNIWSVEQIESNSIAYWKVNKKIQIKKEKKPKTLSWSQELTEKIRNKYPDKLWKYYAPDIQILGEEVLIALGESSKKLGLHIYKDLVLGQLNALNPDSGLKQKMYMDAFPDLYGEKWSY